jgi:hypothetical protein
MYMGVMDSAGSAPTTRSVFSSWLVVDAVDVDELLQALASVIVRAHPTATVAMGVRRGDLISLLRSMQ